MIFNKVRKILADQLSKDESKISPETKIVEDLGADSLDMVELLMLLEENFGITIPDEKAMALKTVGDIVNLIDNK